MLWLYIFKPVQLCANMVKVLKIGMLLTVGCRRPIDKIVFLISISYLVFPPVVILNIHVISISSQSALTLILA